jgi:hypothetical protein
MKKEKKINSRSWQLIIPLDFPVNEIKEKVKLIAKNYYFIKHDKDIDDFGAPKKEHWHYLFTFSNSRDLNTVKNYFADFKKENDEPLLLENSFEKINSIIGSKKYLCHFDHPNKAQYDYREVETNDELFKDLFQPLMSKSDEFDYFKETLLSVKDVSLNAFLDRLKVRFTGFNSHQIYQCLISAIKFHESSNVLIKHYDDGYEPIPDSWKNENDNANNNNDLPF